MACNLHVWENAPNAATNGIQWTHLNFMRELVGLIPATLSRTAMWQERPMLVLTRKIDEGISIGSDIKVIVMGIQGGRVRLGIDAPRDVSIRRGELPRWNHVRPNATPSETVAVDVDCVPVG